MNNRDHSNEHIDEQQIKVEVNIDDMSAEWLGYVMDRLFELGAHDVFYTSIYMKKNRPGVMLQLLCHIDILEDIKTCLFQETTTFGLRYTPMTVHRLSRRWVDVQTIWGNIRVKEGLHGAEVVQRSPEYEDCKAIAQKEGIPIKRVYEDVWKKIDNEVKE